MLRSSFASKDVDLRNRLDRLIDGYESGLLERHALEQRIGPLRERHDRERSALESLRGDASGSLDIESVNAIFESYSRYE